MGNQEDKTPKSALQQVKEEWYSKVPLTLRQLDIIIGLGIAGLVVVTILIILEACGIL